MPIKPRTRPYYELVREEIRANIEGGKMASGLTLYEAALADRLGVSRPPVKRALQLLEQEGLVHRLGRRGYVVGGPATLGRSHANLHALDLDVSDRILADLGRPSWERIVDGVEHDLLACLPFGMFQLSEAILCESYGVSRTVVRDVLSRLQGRGLVGKDRRSHWVAGPLSARAMDDMHAIRRLLEPEALCLALPELDRTAVLADRTRVATTLEQIATADQTVFQRLETDLHRRLLQGIRNQRLLEAVQQSQLALVVGRLFGTYVGVHDEAEMLLEHQLVYDHLLLADLDGSRKALQFHLDADHERARARLKVLSLFDPPQLAPFLLRIH